LLKEVIVEFLGNFKDLQYEQIVKTMLEKRQALGCNMSFKLHFLHSHLDYFPENFHLDYFPEDFGALSEEQGERLHQDIEMERRYQGPWDISMSQ
jgi:hypothetical protein